MSSFCRRYTRVPDESVTVIKSPCNGGRLSTCSDGGTTDGARTGVSGIVANPLISKEADADLENTHV